MDQPNSQKLKKAILAHNAGQLQKANRLYTEILKIQPKHPDANHNLGILAVGDGKVDEALPFLKAALDINPGIIQFWLSYIGALMKSGRLKEAKALFEQANRKGVKDEKLDELERQFIKAFYGQTPSSDQIKSLVNLYNQRRFKDALKQSNLLISYFPKSAILYNIQGAVFQALGQDDCSIKAYKKALLNDPTNADAFNNIGTILKKEGKLKEAIDAFNQAIRNEPKNADAYNNLGTALKEKGLLDKAVTAFRKALTIKPKYAVAHNNLGNTLKEQGKLQKAIEAYDNAIAIKPDYAAAFRNHSMLITYKPGDHKITQVSKLLKHQNLTDSDRCHLHFAYAKMKEDLEELSEAFDNYLTGGQLRQKILAYDFLQDQKLFERIKFVAPTLKEFSLTNSAEINSPIPIFIVGMPRSGTTLIEQILSSHSEVTGAGELAYVARFGAKISLGLTAPSAEVILKFREDYLAKLKKKADGRRFVTDKMPHNFQHIGLICSAFPEAKIVHATRNASATCWSNFKHFFPSRGLGYSYDLRDTVNYYKLYQDLMCFWRKSYCDNIYTTNYDLLTENQKQETQLLLSNIGLNWEDACLAPEHNKRAVNTSSNLQVRRKVYKGSSQAWRKYESFIGHIFNELKEAKNIK